MRTVEHVMSRDVVCARADASYEELVSLLATRRVDAVPVVDDRGCVLGVVSGADLPLRAGATVATELMSQPAVTIGPSATVAEAARRLHAEGVKRLPVVDALGRLVGIVSRLDLLKAFLRSDEELYQEIVEDVIFGDLVLSPDRFDVEVKDGVVVLRGRCERRSLIPTVVRAVAAVDGVVKVVNRLDYAVDDLSSPPSEVRRR
ncbi:MAG TPA: CBS domain-containing protein [Actinomycetota bacterium]|jgi:CBS-domain-containing membrane protein|nr:CBS domain-containing protein [Actinomycetota bacterium]